MSRSAPLVAAVMLATTSAQAEPVLGVLDLETLLAADDRIRDRAIPATITHSSGGIHLRGLIPGGIAFSSTMYCDELESDTMELTTTTSAMSPMIEAGQTIGADLMAGGTVALGPRYTITRGEVMPGNERHLRLLVGFAARR